MCQPNTHNDTNITTNNAWALDHEKVEGGGVTTAWLEKTSKGCGAMRMVMAKVYVRIFLETQWHVMDLPDTSVAKKEFFSVLAPLKFAGYAVFAQAFGTKNGGASSSAAESDDDEKKTGLQAADGSEAPVDDRGSPSRR